jgi:hypothetical protein
LLIDCYFTLTSEQHVYDIQDEHKSTNDKSSMVKLYFAIDFVYCHNKIK